MLWAIAFATPFFVLWGWLSDKIGRKWIMMTGMLLGVLLYRPIFSEFLKDCDPKKFNMQSLLISKSDTVYKKLGADSVMQVTQVCDNLNGIGFKKISTQIFGVDSNHPSPIANELPVVNVRPDFLPDPNPKFIDVKLGTEKYIKFIALVFIMILFVTMVYGPIAAFLVEMFPTKIRYTSMSLPYHIGNGVFGGLVPFIGLLLTTTFTKDPLVGLWYPIGVAAVCFIIGTIYLSNKIDKDVTD